MKTILLNKMKNLCFQIICSQSLKILGNFKGVDQSKFFK